MKTCAALLFGCLFLTSTLRAEGGGEGGGDGNAVLFSDRYFEFVKRHKSPGEPATYEQKSRQSIFAQINVPYNGAGAITAETVVSVTVGEFSHSARLSDDPAWSAGKTEAQFTIAPTALGAGEGGGEGIKNLRYSWANGRFAVRLFGANIGSIVTSSFVGQETKFHVEVPVGLSLGEFSRSLVGFAKGKAKVVEQTHGAESFRLSRVKGFSTLRPPVQ